MDRATRWFGRVGFILVNTGTHARTQVMNATKVHKKASVTMRIAAFHSTNFEFIDSIEFSMDPLSEDQEYSLTWAIGDRHVKLDVGIARNIVSSSTLNHGPWSAN